MSDTPSTQQQQAWSDSAILAVPNPGDGRWWVAHTRPRAEKVLAGELGRLGILHYLPLCDRVTRGGRSGRITRSIVPVFPGYLFFVATETQRYLAMTTNRIAGTLTVPRQEQLIAELRNLHAVLTSGTDVLRSPRLRTGRWVRIIAGPLAGVEGVVRGWRSRLRVALNVNTLGQSVIVETDADLVELIEPPVYAPQVEGDKPERRRKGRRS